MIEVYLKEANEKLFLDLRALENGTVAEENLPLEKRINQLKIDLRAIEDDKYKVAANIGCTFNLGQYKEVNQIFYLCRTCENDA